MKDVLEQIDYGLVDEVYERFQSSIPHYKGKVCVPLSGGLDSRVIAGILGKRRNIELSYCQYFLSAPVKLGTQIKNVKYARDIARITNVKRFEPVCVNYETDYDVEAVKGLRWEHQLLQSRMYTGIRILNERVDLSEYTIVCGHGVDVYTGIAVNPFTLHSYKKHDKATRRKMNDYFKSIFPGTYGRFANWDCPLWKPDLYEWFFSLPMKYRFHQYLYRQMIKKYFPELAEIPREGMDMSVNVNELTYFYGRSKRWLRKLTREK